MRRKQFISIISFLLLIGSAHSLFAGSIVRNFYESITGATITNLTSDPSFPNTPTSSEPLAVLFEGTSNYTDNYGSYIRGYIEAPQTGEYTFWIASDDASELWLSTDANPANKTRIASIATYTTVRAWTAFASQKSAPVTLTRGQKYYVEVLHKDGTGDDNLAVGWTLPDGTEERPMSALHLMPYFAPGTAVAISQPPIGLSVFEGTPATFYVNVDAGTPPTFQWYRNDQPIPDAILSYYTINRVQLTDNNASFHVKVNDAISSTPATLSVATDTTVPTVVSASVLGYDNLVQLTFSEPLMPQTATNLANYSADGGITISKIYQTPDETVVRLITSTFDLNASHSLTISGLKDYAATPNTLNATVKFGNAPGLITRKFYSNPLISGASVIDLQSSTNFPNRPDQIAFHTLFEGQTNWGDNYGSMMQGYVVPDVTGDYVFAIASDDGGSLYLSSDDNPANKGTTAIARVLTYSDVRQYTKETTQWSVPIRLVAGRKYYIEALQKDATGSDNISVAWQLGTVQIPDGTEPIPGANLIPWYDPPIALAITNQPSGRTVEESRPASFSVAAYGRPNYLGVQWYRNGQPVSGANGLTYSVSMVTTNDDGAVFYAVVTNLSTQVRSSDAVLKVTEDTTPPALTSANSQLGKQVLVVFTEILDAVSAVVTSNYSIPGVTISGAELQPDGRSVNLTITGTLLNTYTLTVSSVKDYAGNPIATNATMTGSILGLTPEMVAYWPLNEVQGTKTPDIASGYDMELLNLTAADLVAGKFGKAMQFDNVRQTMLRRLSLPTDDLPIFKNSNFTVSIWVKGAPNQTDMRVFSETSSLGTRPMFNIGTSSTGGAMDCYVRDDNNTASINHVLSTGIVYDDTWHHMVWVQTEDASGIRVAFYIDGVLDPVVYSPRRPITVDTTTLGGIYRINPQFWFSGTIDDVALWKRALTAAEVTQLFTGGTPIPPPKVQPLAISYFRAELPAVAQGDSIVLHWDVSKDATTVEIDQGVGDVLPNTTVGVGSVAVQMNTSKTFKLTVRRDTNEVSATVTVTAIGGVASGWSLIDNFDRYPAGYLADTAYWRDLRGRVGRILDVSGNMVFSLAGVNYAAVLPLGALTLKPNEQRTLFMRLLTQDSSIDPVDQIVGLTEKGIRDRADANGNVGPAVYPNLTVGTSPLQIGVRNGVGGAVEYLPSGAPMTLEANAVYNLWMDVKNVPSDDPSGQGDTFSVYLQKQGESTRVELIKDCVSDRDPAYNVTWGTPGPNLDFLFVAVNTSYCVLLDDFYISKSGFLTDVPRPFGFTTPVGSEPIKIGVGRVGGEVEVTWTSGTLESAPAVTGPWTAVVGAAPPSYKVKPEGQQTYYRIKQ